MGPGPEVKVLSKPNSHWVIGYPGISATLPRIEGKVEIFPEMGSLGPIELSFVRICLQRRESIHPTADKIAKKHLGTPRRDIVDVVGREVTLWKCRDGRESEGITEMIQHFMIPIPFGRGGEEVARRVPPASIQLPSRIVETMYELVVTVQQGHQHSRKWCFPVPLSRYDTLSTFGMYNRAETVEGHSDHLVTMKTSLPKWSYGPGDPITVYAAIIPNLNWISKARKVSVSKIVLTVEEIITFNHEGEEPTTRASIILKKTQQVSERIGEAGFHTNIGCVYPSKELRDSDGIMKRGKKAFPIYETDSFTATGTLYKIEFFLVVKAHLSMAKDIQVKMPIVVCPQNATACKEEMDAIEQAAKDASMVDPNNPMLPAPIVVKPGHKDALRPMGFEMVGGGRRLLID